MNRRRKKGNPLLIRILIISVLAHIIILPILAKLGAFKGVQRELIRVITITLPPPSEQKQPQIAKKKVPKQKPKKVAHKTAHHAPSSHRVAAHHGPSNLPKVVASTGAGGNGGNGATIDNTGTGTAGQVPKPPAGPVKKTAPTQTAQKPTAATTAPQTPQKKTQVAVAEPQPAPKPIPAPAPVYTPALAALALDQEPQPDIPEDLRGEPIDAVCVVNVTVNTDGTASDAQIAKSSGNNELDRAALNAARRWKFQPGTRNGQPVASSALLHFEFKVD